MLYTIFISLLCFVISLISASEIHSKNSTVLAVDVKYGIENTFIVQYNLTTSYSYYVTFRQFEHQQIKLGLFSPTFQHQEYSFKISNQHNTSSESFYLFIVCFYFTLPLNDIDIHCKDIRLLKNDYIDSSHEHHASYKPLFVILMYALSILVILPVAAQHHYRKKALILAREKELKRYSLTIGGDTTNILSKLAENGGVNSTAVPVQLTQLPSTSTLTNDMDDMDDYERLSFTVPNLHLSTNRENVDNESDATAIDCIAHVLNNTPWNSSFSPPKSNINRRQKGSPKFLEPRHVTISPICRINDDQGTTLKSNLLCTKSSYTVTNNTAQSDV